MKKVVTILLISIYTLGATEAYQLLKLPFLVKHYWQHKQANANISLLVFLKEHYPEKIVVDEDFAQDMQLPFKTQQANTTLLEVLPIFHTSVSETIIYHYTSIELTSIYTNPYHTVLTEKSIFQPPKFFLV